MLLNFFNGWDIGNWEHTADKNLKFLSLYLIANVAILTLTFPFGILYVLACFFLEILQGPPSPEFKPGHGQKKKVAIVGAGVSGIVTAKELLEQGCEVVLFDKNNTFGGVWNFDATKRGEDRKEFSGQVWQDLITTSSAYITSFSDFPPEKEYDEKKDKPFHMTCNQYYLYLKSYMEKFGVDKFVCPNTTVNSTDQLPDKRWSVTTTNDLTGKTKTEVYDFVAVCSGQHQMHEEPMWEGLDKFPGKVVHSSDYTNADPYKGQRVLVIGGGDSGADIVKFVADVSKPGETYMSLRRGAHVAPRYFHKDKFPIDYAMFRYAYYMPHLLRTTILRGQFRKMLSKIADVDETAAQVMRLHHLNGMSASNYFTTKSEMMCQAFGSKKAQLMPEVDHFEGNTVHFHVPNPNIAKVPTDPVEVDTVILCTGFTTRWPFLPEGYQKHDNLDRYRLVFHPDLENMGFIGFARPTGFGAIPPCAELQARWFAQVVAGKIDMKKPEELRAHAQARKKSYLKVRKIKNQMLVFFPYYLAELAQEIGASPHMFKLLFTDPKLWWRIMFHPYTCHQYRLVGPGACPEQTRDFLFNKLSYPDEKHNYRGPVQRPNKLIIVPLSIIFGILSKVPFFGRPFSSCI